VAQEINRIIKALEGNINGNPWFGDNLQKQLEGIDSKKATKIPVGLNHSIAEILTHMMAWRQFVVEKLNGNAEYEVWEIPSLNIAEWENILTQLADNQAILLETIYKKGEEQLDLKVDNRQYNFRFILAGIIQHDIYHIGQISIIKKLVN
jgi:uncharacterized damage-inducible protein DinB